ncbi:MAG: IS110 family transposase [Christensenellales bacterium]
MFYLGIDIAKNTHVASLIDEKGKNVFKGFSFSNTTEGGKSLLEIVQKHADFSDVTVGMEATGHYWLSVYSFLYDYNFHSIHVINPIQTDGWRKGTEIRKRKNDIIDSVLIADLIRYGDFVETTLSNEDLFSLRNICRMRNYLVQSAGDLKRKIICILDQVFPEYQSIFSNTFGTTSKQLLLDYSSPADFEELSVETLTETLETLSRKKIGKNTAQKLIDSAKNSFGVTFSKESFTFQLKLLIEQVKFIEDQVKECEAKIKELMTKIDSPITTIPGIGPVLGAIIISEFGDISRFDKPSKLVAFAGIDATVSQSGEFEGTHNVMSKRGSPYLRKALFQAALVASNSDPVLKAFYQKKRAEGKHHKTCIGAVARKLCNIIFAVLKNNKPYEVPKL